MFGAIEASDEGGCAMSEPLEGPPGEVGAAATDALEAEEGGGKFETVIAFIVCALVLLVPLIYFQHRYEIFISESGGIKEGAAGATLALAVIFRTVSRTVLRTIVRTSARAGMKASLKGGLQATMRVLFASLMKTGFGSKGDKPSASQVRAANLRSLAGATALLYASWVIVVGLGQPFTDLKTAEQALAAEAGESQTRRATLEKRRAPAIEAFKKKQVVAGIGEQIKDKRTALKMERDADEQRRIEVALILLAHEEDDAKDELAAAMDRSNNLTFDPAALATEPAPTPADEVMQRFFARAPWPGATSWSSMIIWLGGLLMVLPLWVIYFMQSGLARSMGITLRHETGIDGGVIQLYFAGAFSFMPLTSDVIIEGDTAQQGKIALAGLIGPSLIAMALWVAWKATGNVLLLFAADAFLIYPMVQTFPLNPLDGLRVWRWNKGIWLVVFVFIMTAFMLAGSEGLKNVI